MMYFDELIMNAFVV